jgi:hypothetical protein
MRQEFKDSHHELICNINTHSQRNTLIVVTYITGNKNSQGRYGRKSASNIPKRTAVLLYVTGKKILKKDNAENNKSPVLELF